MSFSNIYPNLPGMLVEFKDGGMSLRQDVGVTPTDSVLILGTAVDGPVLEPVAVDEQTVEAVFGKAVNQNGVSNGSTLVRAFKQAKKRGCNDIRLMRLTGSAATCEIKGNEVAVTDTVKAEDIIGTVTGNDETILELSNDVINADSVKVYVRGVQLLTGFTVDAGSKTVTIQEGVTDAGAPVNVAYTYTNENEEVVEVNENGANGIQFVTATSLMTGTLNEAPVDGKVGIFINYSFGLTAEAEVIVEGKTVSIDKKYFKKGDEISAAYSYVTLNVSTPSIKFESYFGGEDYNKGKVEVLDLTDDNENTIGKMVRITKPDNKRSTIEQPLEYYSTDYASFGIMVEAINDDTRNGIYKASTETPDTLTEELVVCELHFTGGDSGVKISKQELFEALSGKRNEEGLLDKVGAYQLLEDYQVDWIVPVGAYADEELDNKDQSFAYELALLCAILSYRNKTTLGAIAMKPNKDTSLAGVQEYAKHVAGYKNLFLMKDINNEVIKDADGKPMDLGKFLSVVVGPEIEERDVTAGTYLANPAVDYVALNSVLLPQSAPTNKVIHGASKLKFNFSNAQLDAITGNRIITFKAKTERSGKKNVVVVDGITSALPTSDYCRVTTPKALRTVVDNIREVCEPFIGEQNTIEQRNALSAQISKRLSILRDKGVILDSAFQIIVTAEDQVLGSARIELTVVPPQELRKITTVVGLKASL